MKKILLMVFLFILFMGTSVFADTVIKTFSGDGNITTRPFMVNDEWEIQWNTKGEYFALILYMADGTMINLLENRLEPGTGASYQAKGGRYYLKINARGNWEINIVQVGN